MFSFYKKKNFRKIYTLLGISITFFLCLFLNQNLSIKNAMNEINKDLFSRKLLDDYNSFFEIKKITLNGRSKSNLDSIKNIVNSSLDKNTNIVNYDVGNIRNSLEEINWINKIFIRKVFPNKINIDIEEHKEFAIFNKNEKNFLLSQEGKIIHEIRNTKAYKLINIEGKFATQSIDEVKKFLSNNTELKEQISKIIVHSDNRLDLIINNVLFKLPNKNTKKAVNQINRFTNLKNLKMVDLRFFEKKIFLRIDTKKIALKNKK